MKKVKFLAMLMMAFLACASFTACGDDDDDQSSGNGGNGGGASNVTNGGNGGNSAPSFSLIGRSYAYHYVDPNDDGLIEEYTTTVTFLDDTQYTYNDYGYVYIWVGYNKKDWYNVTVNGTYTVSGTTITLQKEDGNITFTYQGDILTESDGDLWFEKK